MTIAALALLVQGISVMPSPDLPPPYVATQMVTGRISIWGHGALGGRADFIETLVKSWQAGFSKVQPGVVFETRLHGTASAIGALYTGTGNLALLGRELWPFEMAAFREVKGYEPLGIDVLTGSFKTRNRGYAIVAFVHKDNPVRRLTLEQLGAIYSAQPGGRKRVRLWGELGAEGDWKDSKIHPMGFPIARGFGEYLASMTFEGGRIWNRDLLEFPDEPGSTGGATDGGQKMLEALSRDPQGIAYSGLLYSHPDVRPLALARTAAGPYVDASEATVLDHSYPLTRIITMFLDRAPGKPVPAHLREFIRYILSRDAQGLVLREGGGYLPILRTFAAKELKKLE